MHSPRVRCLNCGAKTWYLERELLATEHPLLDDNGDGRGTELQIDYLTAEQRGRMKAGKPLAITLKPNSDGSLSKIVRRTFAPANLPTPILSK